MVTHASILPWEIPWTEEPGRLQSTEAQRVGHHWVTKEQQRRRISFFPFQQRNPVVLAPFLGKTILYSLNYLCNLVENQLSICVLVARSIWLSMWKHDISRRPVTFAWELSETDGQHLVFPFYGSENSLQAFSGAIVVPSFVHFSQGSL